MGLLDKTNPKATPRTALRWGIIGSVFSTPIVVLVVPVLRDHWAISLPVMFVVNGLLWALIEWQLDDSDELDE